VPKNHKAQALIITVIALGAIVAMNAAVYWTGHLLAVAAHVALAAFASTLKVRLPGIPGTFSGNCFVTVLALAQLTMAPFVVVSVTCALVQSWWRPVKPPLAVLAAFNAGVFAISAAASAWTYSSLERLAPAIPGIASLILASSVSFSSTPAPSPW